MMGAAEALTGLVLAVTPSFLMELLLGAAPGTAAGTTVSRVAGVAILALWAGALASAALPAYVSHLPAHSADLGVFRIHSGLGATTAAVIGLLVLLVAAPQVTVGLAALDRKLVRCCRCPGR